MEEKNQYKKGLWTEEEDKILTEYIKVHGKGQWNSIPKKTGLKRCGKSCRLRWMNYLSPGVKRGHFTEQEEDLIIRLHKLLGNRWSLIAGRVPGRTDNQVKNYWNTHLSKKLGIRKGNKRPRTSIGSGESTKREANNLQPPSIVSSSNFSYGNCSHEISAADGSLVLTDHPGSTDDVQNCEGEGYAMNPFWISDYDGMMRDTPSFMELIDGHGDSFSLDWN